MKKKSKKIKKRKKNKVIKKKYKLKAKKRKKVNKKKNKKIKKLKSKEIKSIEKIYKVKSEWVKKAFVSKKIYEKKYSQSIKDNDGFWRKEGKKLTGLNHTQKLKM